jgi:hypothetical protein
MTQNLAPSSQTKRGLCNSSRLGSTHGCARCHQQPCHVAACIWTRYAHIFQRAALWRRRCIGRRHGRQARAARPRCRLAPGARRRVAVHRDLPVGPLPRWLPPRLRCHGKGACCAASCPGVAVSTTCTQHSIYVQQSNMWVAHRLCRGIGRCSGTAERARGPWSYVVAAFAAMHAVWHLQPAGRWSSAAWALPPHGVSRPHPTSGGVAAGPLDPAPALPACDANVHGEVLL